MTKLGWRCASGLAFGLVSTAATRADPADARDDWTVIEGVLVQQSLESLCSNVGTILPTTCAERSFPPSRSRLRRLVISDLSRWLAGRTDADAGIVGAAITGDVEALRSLKEKVCPLDGSCAPEVVGEIERLEQSGSATTTAERIDIIFRLLGQPPVAGLRTAARLVDARGPQSLREIVREEARVLPPWTDRWVIDGNLAALRFASGLRDLGADVAIGYAGEDLGVSVRADFVSYEYTGAGLVANQRLDGEIGGSWLFDVGPRTRIELRAVLGGSTNDTRLRNTGQGRLAAAEEERTRSGRLSGLGTLRLQPSTRLVLSATVGLGGQLEDYTALRANGFGVSTPQQTTATMRGAVRARCRVVIIPLVASVRVKADIDAYRTSLGRVETLYFSNLVAQASDEARSFALDFSGRASIDLDFAAVLEIVPAIHAGVDVAWLDTRAGSVTSVVPLAGLGLRRESF
jgi:hypothetical protein